MKDKNCQVKILYPVKIAFKNEGKIKKRNDNRKKFNSARRKSKNSRVKSFWKSAMSVGSFKEANDKRELRMWEVYRGCCLWKIRQGVWMLQGNPSEYSVNWTSEKEMRKEVGFGREIY